MTIPGDGDIDVSPGTVVRVRFSEDLDPTTVTSSSFTVEDASGQPVVGTFDIVGDTATFTPEAELVADTSYTATLGTQITALTGKPLTASTSWSFATADTSIVDVTEPEILSVSPTEGASDVDRLAPLVVTFSEPVDPATMTTSSFSVELAGGASVTGSVSVVADTATFTPDSPLAYLAQYTATISTQVADLAGNELAAEKTWSFTTEQEPDLSPPEVLMVTPADAAQDVARGAQLQVVFSEAVLASTVDGSSFQVQDESGAPVQGIVAANGDTATFTPASALAMREVYTATVTTTITDLVGNPLAADYGWSFTVRDGAWGTAQLIETDGGGDAEDPEVAMDPQGNAMAIWHFVDAAFNHEVVANRYTVGGGWQTAHHVFGDAWDPQIVLGPQGEAIALWCHAEMYNTAIETSRYTPGSGWGSPVYLLGPLITGTSGMRPQLAIGPQGNAVALWLIPEGTWPVLGYSVSVQGYDAVAGTWGSTTTLVQATSSMAEMAVLPAAAVDAQGNATVVMAARTASTTTTDVFARRLNPGAGWDPAEYVENDAEYTGEVAVAAAPAGQSLAVWAQYNGTYRSIWANHYVPGVGWGTPELLETESTGNADDPQVATDPAGNAVAVWIQSDGTESSVWANRYVSGAGWGVAELLEANTGNCMYARVAVDSFGRAHAVWKQSNGAADDIWANRYVPGVGWGAPVLLETDTGDCEHPRLAVDPTGQAIAVWQQFDGLRTNIWANRFD